MASGLAMVPSGRISTSPGVPKPDRRRRPHVCSAVMADPRRARCCPLGFPLPCFRSRALLCVPWQGAPFSPVEIRAGKLSLQPEALGADQEATNGLKHSETRPRRGSADRAGRNASEHRAGLESSQCGSRPAAITGKVAVVGEASETRSRRSTGVVMAARTGHERCATREVCDRGGERQLHANGEPARASAGGRRWRMGSQYVEAG